MQAAALAQGIFQRNPKHPGAAHFIIHSFDDPDHAILSLTAARELVFKEKVTVIFGGIDSPVALAMVPLLNKEKVPHVAVWAAGTGITRNGANPNYIFRVSAATYQC